MKHELKLHSELGSFAANGTAGNRLRLEKIEPFWDNSDQVILNFEGVSSMTDSFANAFIGNIVERHPEDFRSKLRFTKGALQFAQNRLAHQ